MMAFRIFRVLKRFCIVQLEHTGAFVSVQYNGPDVYEKIAAPSVNALRSVVHNSGREASST